MGQGHAQLMRCTVVDDDGRRIGRVVGTAPLDGGGLPDMALVRLGGGFSRERWVPLEGSSWSPGRLRLPVSRDAVEDGPAADDHRWGEPSDVARAHWMTVVD